MEKEAASGSESEKEDWMELVREGKRRRKEAGRGKGAMGGKLLAGGDGEEGSGGESGEEGGGGGMDFGDL